MITAPVNLWAMLKDLLSNNVVNLTDSGAPTNGTSGTGNGFAGPGSTYTDFTNKKRYINTNTAASPTWSLLASSADFSGDATLSSAGVVSLDTRLVKVATGQIVAADIVGTSAGQFGHASGYPVVPAPGANIALWPIAAIISYKFSVAAYTAGGNTTLNWGAGGAAITGLVSAANCIGAAADKPVVLVPLSTVGIALVANASLNLVAASAFTQPGTAAGVINYKVLYTTQVLNTAA